MPQAGDRDHAKMWLSHVTCAALTVLFLVVQPASAAQEKCACKHLDAIRAQREEARRMQDYYQGHRKTLADKEIPILGSTASLAEKEAQLKQLRTETEGAVGRDTTTLIEFDNASCEPKPDSLKRTMDAAACLEAAEIRKHHEDYHHDVCVTRRAAGARRQPEPRRTSRPIDLEMLAGFVIDLPSADAWEEAESYALELGELRELIDKLERDLRYVLNFKSFSRMDWRVPMGIVGNAAEYASTARIPLEVEEGPAPQRVTGRAPSNFEGRVIGGRCQYTGMPMEVPLTLDGTLDGGMFKLKFNQAGTRLPGFGVSCPQGGGMVSPMMQPPPQGPSAIEIEARDGAKVIYPYATSPMAFMISQVGRLSGEATMELEGVCKPEP